MVLIIAAIAAIAWAAISWYNGQLSANPTGIAATVTGIRQSTSTVLGVTNGIVTILNALQGQAPKTVNPLMPTTGTTIPVGTTPSLTVAGVHFSQTADEVPPEEE